MKEKAHTEQMLVWAFSFEISEDGVYRMVSLRLSCRLLSCGCIFRGILEDCGKLFEKSEGTRSKYDFNSNINITFRHFDWWGKNNHSACGGVTKKNEEYFFDYTKFHRWITLCKEIGFDYFEMSHLFSQWGAKFPPKIVAEQRLKESGKRFLDAGMEDGWTYYCVGQGYKVSNRFIAMPGWRTRILGVQLYKYRMEGFLHWGFNFYNTQYSLHPVDPYRENDADDAFPAGDAFIVYPGENGEVVESMRLPLIEDAMLDVRLLEYLEELTDRETVMKLVEQNESFEIRFDEYPRGAEYLLNL